jgi:hypothetical protein
MIISSLVPAPDHLRVVDVDIDGDGSIVELAHLLDRAVADTAFRLDSVEVVASSRTRCRFVPRRDGLVLGYRNAIELQSRLDRIVRLVGVSCESTIPVPPTRVA